MLDITLTIFSETILRYNVLKKLLLYVSVIMKLLQKQSTISLFYFFHLSSKKFLKLNLIV